VEPTVLSLYRLIDMISSPLIEIYVFLISIARIMEKKIWLE
jgi:hypothetical protein